MKQSLSRHSSMFLMEIIIAILFFSLVSAICLRIFTASHQMGQDTNDLNMAVNQTENIAELLTYASKEPGFSSSDMEGLAGFLTSEYPDIDIDDNILSIYYDENWNCCTAEEGTYFIKISGANDETLSVFDIDAYKASDRKKPVYSLTVSLHSPLHP